MPPWASPKERRTNITAGQEAQDTSGPRSTGHGWPDCAVYRWLSCAGLLDPSAQDTAGQATSFSLITRTLSAPNPEDTNYPLCPPFRPERFKEIPLPTSPSALPRVPIKLSSPPPQRPTDRNSFIILNRHYRHQVGVPPPRARPTVLTPLLIPFLEGLQILPVLINPPSRAVP